MTWAKDWANAKAAREPMSTEVDCGKWTSVES